tara:strand:- start:300 stop:1055 length:756 start_codon:yes stop_codon:yes gene_type:complete
MNAVSLLRYPGGKTRAVNRLLSLIPEGVEICSPFVGGASVEIALSNRGQMVKCYDNYEPIVCFWQSVASNANLLHKKVLNISNCYNVDKLMFKDFQESIKNRGKDMDAKFFILNRCSFSGSTNSGGMSKNHPRFNKSCTDKMLNFKSKNITFELMDFKESIKENPEAFLFLDPPYDIDCFLYGDKGSTHKNFDHNGLSKILNSRKNWLMTYNDNGYIRDLYKDCKIEEIEWAYGMNKSKKSNEIIITPTPY